MHRRSKIDLKQDSKEVTLEGRGKLAQGRRAGDEETSSRAALLNGPPKTMPGILEDPEESKIALAGEVQESKMGLKDLHMTDQAQDTPLMNGTQGIPHTPYTNGVAPTPPEVHRPMTHTTGKLVGQLPPEIEHWTMGYVPLSELLGRLVQETFNGLEDLINDMAEITLSQPLTNGAINHVNQRNGAPQSGDASQANVQKKVRIFDFANGRRAQFIKVLVLSRWARQAESISNVIDLRIWLSQKQEDYNSAVSWMGELKRKLAALVEPSPDIRTALEVLSLGKVSWLSDLGYLPPPKLSTQQILDGLRRINTLLSIRLNLYETIPPILRNFCISSGRASFKVPDEFEVDLSIADEDPSQQLYFVDFRPMFSPAPAAFLAGRLRVEFEARANEVLGRDGLQGLFDFMHNLILTHKLVILRNQAFEMARGHWAEHLKIEPVRRSVAVQYWCNRPGTKNWIEIGIRRGNAGRISHMNGDQRIPVLGLRWFRGGKEISDVKVDLKLGDLSMEYILKQIIAQHTDNTFFEIAATLSRGLLYSSGCLRMKRGEPIAGSADASLLVQVTTLKAIKLVQEPVSGRFAILPASALNSRAEYELNRLAMPAKEGSNQISYLRAAASHAEIELGVHRIGWETIRLPHLNQEAVRRLFPKSTQRTRFFRRNTWDKGWVLAFTTGPDGDCWFVVELSDCKLTTSAASSTFTGSILRAAYRIPLNLAEPLIMDPSRVALTQVERDAAGLISKFIDARHLAGSRMPHRVQPASSTNGGQRSMSIYFRLLVPQALPMLRSPNPLTLPWANEIIKLEYRGLNSTHSAAIHVASARLNRPFSNMEDLANSMPDAAFHQQSGAFAIQLQNKVGEISIPNVTRSLSIVERLRNFAAVTKAHGLITNTTSLDRFKFTYQQSPSLLNATIHFHADAALIMTLSSPNPHLRIVDHLTTNLQSHGLAPVLALMKLSLPLLTTFARLESSTSPDHVKILARSEQWYQVRYVSATAKGGFDVQLRQRRDDPKWFISDCSIKQSDPASDEEVWKQSLKHVTRGKGEGWRGMNGGIVANVDGIQEVVEKLHEVFLSITGSMHEPSRPEKRKTEGDIVEID